MHLNYRNVNDAFYDLVYRIHHKTLPLSTEDSRVGQVIRVAEPVLITYSHPKERVLFNSARDANPFFHLYEALWMLAGRNDVAPLAYYNSKIAEIASDDGETFNGAYGFRWRYAKEAFSQDYQYDYEEHDQLQILINHLKENPNSRRAVLQMWNVEDDLLKIDATKDVCCNTSIYFSIRKQMMFAGGTSSSPFASTGRYETDTAGVVAFLDMAVMNRSNDLVLGMLGANYVHFTILQEYMAALLGIQVGKYHHFTNNLHVYTNNWKPEEWLGARFDNYDDVIIPVPLVRDPEQFDKELLSLVDLYSDEPAVEYEPFTEPFLEEASCMLTAFYWHKQRKYRNAITVMDDMNAKDWRFVANEWVYKREQNWLKKDTLKSVSDVELGDRFLKEGE